MPATRGGPTKARIAFQLREMAASAVSTDFAAGLRAAADLIDGTKHACSPPNYGHYFHCEPCGLKWYGFHPVASDGSMKVEWVTVKKEEAAS